MKQIMEKIINSGDLLWEELFYISLGEELGIRRVLGTAAGSFLDIYKKGAKDALVAVAPAVKGAIEDAYSLGSAAIGPTDVSTDKITVTDLSKIDTVPPPSPELMQELLLKSSADNLNINVMAGVKNVIVEEELAFKSISEIDEYIIDLTEEDLSLLNKKELEKEKNKVNKTKEALYKYKKKLDTSSEDNVIVDQNLDALDDRYNLIEERINKLAKKQTVSGSKKKPKRHRSLPLTGKKQKNEKISQQLIKDIIVRSEALRESSTPDLTEATKKLLKEHENIPISPLTPGEQSKLDQIEKEMEKDNKNIPTKPVARKLEFSDDEPKENPKPVKIPEKIKLKTKGEKGLYKATLKDNSDRHDREFEFDDIEDLIKKIAHVDVGEINDRYILKTELSEKLKEAIKHKSYDMSFEFRIADYKDKSKTKPGIKKHETTKKGQLIFEKIQ